jgi:hypothetical protein
MIRLAVGASVVVVGIGALGYVSLARWTDSVRVEVAELQAKQEVSSQQRNTIALLLGNKKELDQQWLLLESLRAGMPAKGLMESVQQAMRADEVWFVDWRLRRAGIVTEKATTADNPGYFVIVKKNDRDEDWHAKTHMTVRGQARDHATLSEFAQRLLEHSDIEDVLVQRTSQAFGRDRSAVAVDFDLAIVLDSDAGQS